MSMNDLWTFFVRIVELYGWWFMEYMDRKCALLLKQEFQWNWTREKKKLLSFFFYSRYTRTHENELKMVIYFEVVCRCMEYMLNTIFNELCNPNHVVDGDFNNLFEIFLFSPVFFLEKFIVDNHRLLGISTKQLFSLKILVRMMANHWLWFFGLKINQHQRLDTQIKTEELASASTLRLMFNNTFIVHRKLYN